MVRDPAAAGRCGRTGASGPTLSRLPRFLWRPPTASRRLAEQSLEAFRHRGDAHGVALATSILGDLEMRRALEESVRINREAALALESNGDVPNLCWVLINLALGLAQLGDLAEAERTVRREIADARQHGPRYLLAAGFRVLAGILRLRGDLVAADRLLAESDPLMAGLDDLRFGITGSPSGQWWPPVSVTLNGPATSPPSPSPSDRECG